MYIIELINCIGLALAMVLSVLVFDYFESKKSQIRAFLFSALIGFLVLIPTEMIKSKVKESLSQRPIVVNVLYKYEQTIGSEHNYILFSELYNGCVVSTYVNGNQFKLAKEGQGEIIRLPYKELKELASKGCY
jgi:hypothetical protein|nr:MAG TPA: hypothetical protein [Bacteriophage sp.]